MTNPFLKRELAKAASFHDAGDLEQAEILYRAILEVSPRMHDVVHRLGVLHLQRGDAESAIGYLKEATKADNANADYHNRLGIALARHGATADAIEHYRIALQLDPEHAEAHNNFGLALAETGVPDAAARHYRAALKTDPKLVEAHNNLAVVLAAHDRDADALRHYGEALKLRPHYAAAHANLGAELTRMGRYDEGIAHLRAAVEIEPDATTSRAALADALARRGCCDEALRHAESVLQHEPKNVTALIVKAHVHRQQGELDEAEKSIREVLAIAPDSADAHTNLAIVLADGGDVEKALTSAETAGHLAPESAPTRLNLAMIRLLRGDFEQGLAGYAARWETPEGRQRRRPFLQTPWHGENLDGRAILVWGEQGIGEEIMFASALAPVVAGARRCVIECDMRLVPLFARSWPDAGVCGRQDRPNRRLLDGKIDYQCPSGDLLRWQSNAGARSSSAYLMADPDKVDSCRQRYKAWGKGPRVGIAWRSTGPNASFGATKSSPLDAWAPVLQQADCQFVNLQYGPCDDILAAAQRQWGAVIHVDEQIDQLDSLDDFAAQIAALDLVITTSNTTAHLAGALGMPVWIALPHVPDWRWGLGRESSRWYPEARLFRQPSPGDWAAVFAQIGRALESWRP